MLGVSKIINRAVKAAPFLIAFAARSAIKFPAILIGLVSRTVVILDILTMLYHMATMMLQRTPLSKTKAYQPAGRRTELGQT